MAEYENSLLLDASDFVSEADDAAESMDNVDTESQETQESLIGFDGAGDVAAGAVAGVGGAMTLATEGSKDWRESLGRTRTDMGITQDEAEGLAQSISNQTFPMDDAVSTMDSLAQQGITTADEMETVAGAADNVADATGQSAESIATNLGPAVTSLGDDLTDLPEKQDSYTKAMRDTMLDAPQFSKVLQQNADGLNEMGLNSAEASELLGAYAEETGLTGRELRQNFREDVQGANGDLSTFQDETGVTEQSLQSYGQEVTKSGDLTSQYADNANESLTAVDKLGNFTDELMLSFGGLLDPLSAVGPILTALSTAWIAFGGVITGTIAPAITGTLLPALGGIALPITAIVAAVVGLYLAWENNFLGIQDITADVVDWLTQKINELWAYLEPLFRKHLSTIADEFSKTATVWREAIAGFIEWARPYVNAFLDAISSWWDEHGDTVMNIVDTLMSGVQRLFEDYLSVVVDVVVGMLALLRGDFEGVKESIMSIVDTLVTGVVDLFEWIYTKLVGGSIIPDLVNDAIGYITGLKDDAISLVGDLASGMRDKALSAKDNVVGAITDMKDTAIGIADDLAGGVVDSISGIGSDAAGMVRSGFNDVVPSSLSIPTIDIDNPVPGESGWTIGGGSLSLPQLDTGGMIESTGAAIVHRGEEIVRAADVRRNGSSGGSSDGDVDIDIHVNGAQSPEATAKAIDRRLSSAGVDAWRS